jgi:hypothetical protein
LNPPDASTTTAKPAATPAAASSTTTGASAGVKDEVQIICREAWRAAPIQGQLVGHRIERLTVHHTGVAVGRKAEAPRRMRSYQSYHQELGWSDIAYHYMVDANGHVYEGRPVSVRGDTFTEYDPTGHLLLCCDGHFDFQGIPEPQMSSLAAVLAWACAQFGVDPATIAGHRDFAATTCPGSQLAGFIADGTLRSMVERRIAGGGVPASLLCGPAGVVRVAEIEAGRR